MAKTAKQFGRVYTPDYIVQLILDFGGYFSSQILCKNVIDNSCGNGAFLTEIVDRYCSEFLKINSDTHVLKEQLELYIHGIEIDKEECESCIENLNQIVQKYNLHNLSWDILNEDALSIDGFNGKMDFVFGNPPYVRVHNLDHSYDAVKAFRFTEKGMTDLFIVFFEIGFKMLAQEGTMSIITPSSWLSSKAGLVLRNYILQHQNLSGLIDLEHFQAFSATTYTLISRFKKSKPLQHIEYYTFNEITKDKHYQNDISYKELVINHNFYVSSEENLATLRKIQTTHSYKYVSVKNGFATLADKCFIGDFSFSKGTIEILKASTGKWSRCIYPYDKNGKAIPLQLFMKNEDAYQHLLSFQNELSKNRDIENENCWYLFGRTQALKDVFNDKIAINIIIKDLNSIRLEKVQAGKGVYSGLYILTTIDFETIQKLILSPDFISYVKLLKNYKSGGYYTYMSKDLEQYLNYKLSELYGQSRISNNNIELF